MSRCQAAKEAAAPAAVLLVALVLFAGLCLGVLLCAVQPGDDSQMVLVDVAGNGTCGERVATFWRHYF